MTTEVCRNCGQSREAEIEELHAAPCAYCGSVAHSACQHQGDLS